jgi:hypothetical protein
MTSLNVCEYTEPPYKPGKTGVEDDVSENIGTALDVSRTGDI